MALDITFDAIILAGGESRRMGQDKALLRFGSRTFLEHAVTAVRRADQIMIVGPKRAPFEFATWVSESVPFGGPVAGLASAAALLEAEVTAILAVDMPSVDDQVVEALVSSLAADVVLMGAPEDLQPLPMACRTDWLQRRLGEIEPRGTSLRHLLERSSLHHLPGPHLVDCDTPEEFETLEFFGR